MPTLGQGSIILADLVDPQGHNPKVRPAVVVTSDADIRAGEALTGVAITGAIDDPLPDTQIELPWDPTGKARTDLKKRSVAVCDWQAVVEQSDVQRIIGHLPHATALEVVRRVIRSE
jgi:mRNA-degrading endonuclease toxin of MazEF toxin-antitoxin module